MEALAPLQRVVNKSPVDYFALYKGVALQGGMETKPDSSKARNRFKRQAVPFACVDTRPRANSRTPPSSSAPASQPHSILCQDRKDRNSFSSH